MYKDRKFFQANLRKNVDIKEHIASNFYQEVVKDFSSEMRNFAKKTVEQAEENEK